MLLCFGEVVVRTLHESFLVGSSNGNNRLVVFSLQNEGEFQALCARRVQRLRLVGFE
jgi:hypothetical protein